MVDGPELGLGGAFHVISCSDAPDHDTRGCEDSGRRRGRRRRSWLLLEYEFTHVIKVIFNGLNLSSSTITTMRAQSGFP